MIRPPLTAFDHFAGDSLQAEESSSCVDPVHTVPVLRGEVHDVRPTGNSGVIHEYVDALEGIQSNADHAIDIVNFTYIGLYRDGRVAQLPHRDAGLFRRRAVDVGRDYAGAFRSQSYGDGPANPLARAGDEGNLVLQIHGNLPAL